MSIELLLQVTSTVSPKYSVPFHKPYRLSCDALFPYYYSIAYKVRSGDWGVIRKWEEETVTPVSLGIVLTVAGTLPPYSTSI